MIYNWVVDFNEWMSAKYREWRGDAIGRDRTMTEFAEYIGVSQQLMSDWTKQGGKTPKSLKTISKLFAVYGDEIWEVVERPDDPDLARMMAAYYSLPADTRKILADKVVQWALEILGAKRIG